MNNLSRAEFEEVLTDVRRAYRLLYLYQNRVLNTARFIGERLGFDYQGGYPWFSNNTPKEGKGDLESWAWDWLNMYYYEFHFRDKQVAGQTIVFGVVIQSDTGFHDSSSGEGTEIHRFAPVDVSQTRLRLLVGKNAWTSDFEGVFDATSKSANSALFVGSKTDGSGTFLAQSYPLADFLDETTTRQALAHFVQVCEQHGITEMRLA